MFPAICAASKVACESGSAAAPALPRVDHLPRAGKFSVGADLVVHNGWPERLRRRTPVLVVIGNDLRLRDLDLSAGYIVPSFDEPVPVR